VPKKIQVFHDVIPSMGHVLAGVRVKITDDGAIFADPKMRQCVAVVDIGETP
jgi:hypothetical protein